jgi:hypothetical protein
VVKEVRIVVRGISLAPRVILLTKQISSSRPLQRSPKSKAEWGVFVERGEKEEAMDNWQTRDHLMKLVLDYTLLRSIL